jgi:U3 small nucleolar RNA-associated protein 22
LLNPENAYNSIEKGSLADSSEAQDFRDFWGNKSEMRRFKDGSICETVFWEVKTFADKPKIITQSLQRVTNEKVGHFWGLIIFY